MQDRYGTKIEIGDTVMAADDWSGEESQGTVIAIEKPKPRNICGQKRILPACKVAFKIDNNYVCYTEWKYPEEVLAIKKEDK